MNIILYGAGGMIGSRILQEALRRGHGVKAVMRDPSKFSAPAGVTVAEGDVLDAKDVACIVKGADAVASAVGGSIEVIAGAPASLLEGMMRAAARRVVLVGGAGSLEVAPGVQLVDTPNFPPAYKAVAIAHRDALNVLRTNKAIAWTCVCPSAEIAPGKRTGKFRIGRDQLLVDEDGKSHISAEDYAIAFMDEVEQATHVRQRFTVGY